MVVFRGPRVAWRFQTLMRFPAVKEVEKKVVVSQRSGKPETPHSGLEFDHFKRRPQSRILTIFKYICWLNGSYCMDDDQGFMKYGVKTDLISPTTPLNSPTFLLSSHL
jgi:hypothetical protein